MVSLMKYPTCFLALLLITIGAAAAFGQGKGVDSQSQRITDNSANKAPANNGTKQDVGTSGSGINFGKEKTSAKPILPNPYRLTARRDALIKAVADVMRDRKLILDDAASKPDEGIIVSQPYTFIKGSVVTTSELYRYATVVNENFDLRSFLLNFKFSRGGCHLAFVSLAEIQVSSEDRAGKNQGAEYSDKQTPRVALFFFLNRKRLGFQLIQDLHDFGIYEALTD